jgi:hypothetical protein
MIVDTVGYEESSGGRKPALFDIKHAGRHYNGGSIYPATHTRVVLCDMKIRFKGCVES